MLADNGHPEIGAILTAVPLRNREAQMSGVVGKISHPAQQRLPFRPRQSAMLEISARPFAAVIEEADVVIGFFNRLDLARDELVEFGEVGDQVGRQCKIQGNSPRRAFLSLSRGRAETLRNPIKVRSGSQVKQWNTAYGAEAPCVIRWRRRA